MVPFILDNDRIGLFCSDLSTSSLRFLYGLNAVGQFNAFPIKDRTGSIKELFVAFASTRRVAPSASLLLSCSPWSDDGAAALDAGAYRQGEA
jgi:hypothetical protein